MNLYFDIIKCYINNDYLPLDYFEQSLTDIDTLNSIVELTSFQTLQKIKAVIDDDSLNDNDCFMKIESIICAFEHIGSNGGNRHDF